MTRSHLMSLIGMALGVACGSMVTDGCSGPRCPPLEPAPVLGTYWIVDAHDEQLVGAEIEVVSAEGVGSDDFDGVRVIFTVAVGDDTESMSYVWPGDV